MNNIMPIGGDKSDIECPICSTFMTYIEYRHPLVEDDSELGFICEECEKSYEDILKIKKEDKDYVAYDG